MKARSFMNVALVIKFLKQMKIEKIIEWLTILKLRDLMFVKFAKKVSFIQNISGIIKKFIKDISKFF